MQWAMPCTGRLMDRYEELPQARTPVFPMLADVCTGLARWRGPGCEIRRLKGGRQKGCARYPKIRPDLAWSSLIPDRAFPLNAGLIPGLLKDRRLILLP